MHINFIDTQEKLSTICQQFAQSPFLAVDSEFIRQNTYHPILALLQICDGQQVAIIDPLAVKDLAPLMALLYKEEITKVLHSARQDMEIFYDLNQSVPNSLFDTQIAAALLGYGEQISYAALVKQLLNVDLDKSQTRTDWLRRPLKKKQIEYAANDVIYLAQLYPLQKKKLLDLGRLDWLDKDFQYLSSNSTYQPSLDTIWRKIKRINHLKTQKLAILKNLASYREQLAIQHNRPRRKIISDDTLLNLVANTPKNEQELNDCATAKDKHLQYFLQHNSKKILSLIEQGLQTLNKDCPVLPTYKKLSQNEEAVAACLMAIVHLCASNNNISTHFLCSRKELDNLISGQQDLSILSGWKNELLGKHLVQFLAGDSQLSYESGQLLLVNDNSDR